MMSDLIPYLGVLVKGAFMTLELSALSLLFSFLIGAVLGMAATSRVTPLRVAVKLYVELIRSVPLLVQLFFAYYALPLVLGVNLSPYKAATLALSLYAGAFMAEAVRSGIQSVGRSQWAAARSLAMGYRQTMLYIVAPQALRVTLPAAAGIFIDLLKGASVTSIIGFVELLQTAVNIRNVTFTLTPLVAAAVLYFIMCFSLTRVGSRIEHALRYGDR
jgi:His/Glu/Gln/Arg/opine family amino acid ABC transporter permease subunit